MNKLVDLLEAHMDELTALEALDAGESVFISPCSSPLNSSSIGKFYNVSKRTDVGLWIRCMRYYAGWADKIQGKTVEVCFSSFSFIGCLPSIDERRQVGVYEA